MGRLYQRPRLRIFRVQVYFLIKCWDHDSYHALMLFAVSWLVEPLIMFRLRKGIDARACTGGTEPEGQHTRFYSATIERSFCMLYLYSR